MAATRSHRPARIAEVLKREITEIINYELDDPRIRQPSVTHVKVSSDLRHARVFVSLLGSRQEIDETLHQLNHAAGYIQRQLYPRLHLRAIPHLVFNYDETLEVAARLEYLLSEESVKPGE